MADDARQTCPRIDWSEISCLLQERCAYLERGLDESLGLGELLKDLQKYYPDAINQQVVEYWRKVGILDPTRAPKGRRLVWKYPVEQVRRAHLAAILMSAKYNLSPTVIRGAVSAWFARELTATAQFAVDIGEASRGQMLLAGRLLGVIASLVTARRSPPPDCILVCRRMPDQASTHPPIDGFRVVHYSSQEVRGLLDPREMLVGFSTPEPDPEILIRLDKLGDIESRLGGREYVEIQVCLDETGFSAGVIVGFRQGTTGGVSELLSAAPDSRNLPLANDPTRRQLLARLLRYVFEVVIRFSDALSAADPRHRIPRNADLLTVLVTAVLLAAPDRWDYAAFLAPTAPDVLRTLAHTPAYPTDAREAEQALNPRRHLESWVIENKQPIVVEGVPEVGIGARNTAATRPQGFAMIPGLAGGQVRGVLSVGAGRVTSGGQSGFPPADVSFLHLMASVIAEGYARRQLSSITSLVDLIPESDITCQRETDLRRALQSLLVHEVVPAALSGDPNRPLADEYLVLIMVRVIGIASPQALSWFISRIATRMDHFIRKHAGDAFGAAELGNSVYLLENDRLVGVLGHVRGEARDVTEDLSRQLEPLAGLVDRAKVFAWRLYYNYDWLGRDLRLGETVDNGRVERWIDYMISGAKHTLAAIEYIASANENMAQGNYREAAMQLEEARRTDPDNGYILRHLVQAYYHLGRYDRAIELARQTVQADKRERKDYAGSRLWLGKALLGAGEDRAGLEELRAAVALSETPEYVRSYVEALLRDGTGDEYQKAITLLDKVLDEAQPMGVERAWLYALKGEVYRELGLVKDAVQALEMAANCDRANPALHRMLDRLQSTKLALGTSAGTKTQ